MYFNDILNQLTVGWSMDSDSERAVAASLTFTNNESLVAVSSRPLGQRLSLASLAARSLATANSSLSFTVCPLTALNSTAPGLTCTPPPPPSHPLSHSYLVDNLCLRRICNTLKCTHQLELVFFFYKSYQWHHVNTKTSVRLKYWKLKVIPWWSVYRSNFTY